MGCVIDKSYVWDAHIHEPLRWVGRVPMGQKCFNLPLLVLKAGSAFCTRLEVPEQALGLIPIGLGLVVKINLLNIHGNSIVVIFTYI